MLKARTLDWGARRGVICYGRVANRGKDDWRRVRILLVRKHESLRHRRDGLSVLEDNVGHAQTDGR